GQSKLVGGLLLLMFGRTVHYAYAGWSWKNQSLRVNDALHWQAIQYACSNGFRYYDLGFASKTERGLAQYKSKWGAQPKCVYSYCYSTSRGLKSGISKPTWDLSDSAINIHDPGSRIRQCALAILRRLPTRMVALLSKWAHHL